MSREVPICMKAFVLITMGVAVLKWMVHKFSNGDVLCSMSDES